jgi:hypothetical protein
MYHSSRILIAILGIKIDEKLTGGMMGEGFNTARAKGG